MTLCYITCIGHPASDNDVSGGSAPIIETARNHRRVTVCRRPPQRRHGPGDRHSCIRHQTVQNLCVVCTYHMGSISRRGFHSALGIWQLACLAGRVAVCDGCHGHTSPLCGCEHSRSRLPTTGKPGSIRWPTCCSSPIARCGRMCPLPGTAGAENQGEQPTICSTTPAHAVQSIQMLVLRH